MTNIMALIVALIAVESGGNDLAVSPDGTCRGPLQEKSIYVADVNRIAATHYRRNDVFDRTKAIEMFQIYIDHYATSERLGREPTWEDMARIHSGGPDGWKNPSTKAYWRRVRGKLRAATPQETKLPSDTV
jgi:hypothetical protein